MAKVDKTESRLKIIGFVGAIIGGFSTMAVSTWKTMKEQSKINEANKEEKADEESSKSDS